MITAIAYHGYYDVPIIAVKDKQKQLQLLTFK